MGAGEDASLPAGLRSMDGHHATDQSPREFASLVFARFRARRIRYCVVRWNPELWHDGLDIDVFVATDDLDNAADALSRLAAERNGIIVNVNAYRGRRHFMVALPAPDFAPVRLIEFDLQTYAVEGDLLVARADWILQNVEDGGEVPVPARPMDASLRLLRSVLRRGSIKDSDWQVIDEAVSHEPDKLLAILTRLLGPGPAAEVVQCAKNDDRTTLIAMRAKLVAARLSVDPESRYVEEKSRWARGWWRLKGLARPPGVFLCLVGTDGAGKTTIGRGIAETLTSTPYPVRYVYCGRGVSGGNGNRANAASASAPAAFQPRLKAYLRPRGRLRMLWVALLVAYRLPREIWVYLTRVRPVLCVGGVVIGDRYYFDILANVYEELPACFVRAVIRMLPCPLLVVHLFNSPEVIHARKQERTVREVEQAIQRLRQVSVHIPVWRERKTDRPAPDVAWELIREVMHARTKRQWPMPSEGYDTKKTVRQLRKKLATYWVYRHSPLLRQRARSRLLAEIRAHDRCADLVALQWSATPRGNLIGELISTSDGRRYYAKSHLLLQDRCEISRNFEALQALQSLRRSPTIETPEPVALLSCACGDGAVLVSVETAVGEGHVAARGTGELTEARLVEAWKAMNAAWAYEHQSPAESLAKRLARFFDTVPLTSLGAKLRGPITHATEALNNANWPRWGGIEHGDLSPGNVVLIDTTRTGVIDWADMRKDGLPELDLIHLVLSYHALRNGGHGFFREWQKILEEEPPGALLEMYESPRLLSAIAVVYWMHFVQRSIGHTDEAWRARHVHAAAERIKVQWGEA